jgi:hypothetical protein
MVVVQTNPGYAPNPGHAHGDGDRPDLLTKPDI